jgi:hypothetical protein
MVFLTPQSNKVRFICKTFLVTWQLVSTWRLSVLLCNQWSGSITVACVYLRSYKTKNRIWRSCYCGQRASSFLQTFSHSAIFLH